MNNETTTFILDYAEVHHQFRIKDLFDLLHEKNKMNKSSLSWYLHKLVNDKLLSRISRGVYTKVLKRNFAPSPSTEVKELYALLKTAFPFAKFCTYQGEIIAPLQHHLSPNHLVYVETEKNTAESIFNFLKDKNYNTYLRPNMEMIYRYVDMDSRNIIVKNLVSEAPIQDISGIPMPSLEKLLVDILRDPDFFYLQGSESDRIIENAFNLYTINRSKLLRYAERRKAKNELLSILKNLNIE